MGTSLLLLTNSKLTGNETKNDWDRIISQLEQLQLGVASYLNANHEYVEETGSWEYFIELEGKNTPFNVEFEGPHAIFPRLYSNIGVISTIYRFSLLYENYTLHWFNIFRTELYKVVKAIGGTEVIYVADNSCGKISKYLESMAWENVPYEVIKERMIQEFGPPVTDYSKLDYGTLSYENINEFFLDDFSDLKTC